MGKIAGKVPKLQEKLFNFPYFRQKFDRLILRTSIVIAIIGRFYARDVKVVKTHLTSETLKPSGIKTGRIKVAKLTDKNKIFLKKLLGSIIGRHWARANSAPNKR